MARPTGTGEVKEDGQLRISFTVTPEIRKNIRIAAALADQDTGDWIVGILEKAAEKAVPASVK